MCDRITFSSDSPSKLATSWNSSRTTTTFFFFRSATAAGSSKASSSRRRVSLAVSSGSIEREGVPLPSMVIFGRRRGRTSPTKRMALSRAVSDAWATATQ